MGRAKVSMENRKIYVKSPDSCTGCLMCKMVCALHHEKGGVNPRMSRIGVHFFPEKGVITPQVCRLCARPACIEACPENALSQDKKSGVILLHAERCTGCGTCVDACAFNAMFMNPETEKIIVCDLCEGDPQCVRYCMNNTLLFMHAEEYKTVKEKVLSSAHGK
jgi:carbon-monoxide dehydrogenase iron sulfur subunit